MATGDGVSGAAEGTKGSSAETDVTRNNEARIADFHMEDKSGSCLSAKVLRLMASMSGRAST
jgi:hypothetical protein